MDGAVRVVVDDRERGEEVRGRLESDPRVRVTVARLACGDYLVADGLLAERKTTADFAASLVDGRLFRQACRISRQPCRAVYILEGSFESARGPEITREALQGAMVALTVRFGLPVLRSDGPAETARLMVYAGTQMVRAARGDAARPGYRPRSLRRRRLYVLQAIRGVGPDRANRLLEALGSVESVFRADVKQLVAIDGVGPVTARHIREVAGG